MSSNPKKQVLELQGLSKELYFLTDDMKARENKIISPRSFRENLAKINPIFGTKNQQDAHEALQYILDSMSEDDKKAERNIIEETFDGEIKIKIECRKCDV